MKTYLVSKSNAGRFSSAPASAQIIRRLAVMLGAVVGFAGVSFSAGILTPRGSIDQPIQITNHHVNITINNGFARTEVSQTFFNPNQRDLEAVYSFPLPKSASLSEVTLTMGERTIEGEVVEKVRAQSIYESEKQNGSDAGLAIQNGYTSFEFRVHPVRAQDQTQIRIVYYQPIEIDTGIGRFVYPLEEGGTDEVAASFWNPVSAKVEGMFSAEIELKSAWPVADVRLPGYENDVTTEQLGEGHYKVKLERQGQPLTSDLVVYYRLQDNLPGRVELIPYRSDAAKPGTFMMVITPGLDLKPLNRGADYVYVLDTSGSMDTKLHTLTDGVSRVLGAMSGDDRFRVISFSDSARDLTGGWQTATPENVKSVLSTVGNLRSSGGTNIHEGLSMALGDLDDDRATSVVLVTDGVTNRGIVDPVEFHKLTKAHDIRVFGFLLGNSSNWPLMRTVCDSSGGFYASVSNADDILGQIMQAKSKIQFECLHDAEFEIKGVKTFNTTGQAPGKIYRGQQLVMFGRYEGAGEAELTLKARMTGEDKVYQTSFTFPEIDTENPELERLWALDQIEGVELKANTCVMPQGEAQDVVRDLGLEYQLVTNETSMLVLTDEAFARHGVERRNLQRVQTERAAQTTRAAAEAPKNRQVDQERPLTKFHAPSLGGGGGALPPFAVLALAAFAGLALRLVRRQKG